MSTGPCSARIATASLADVTMLVPPDCAHCHSFASSLQLLWERLGSWAEGAGAYLRLPT
jgi:hypothetical protein